VAAIRPLRDHPTMAASDTRPKVRLRDVTEDDVAVFFEYQADPEAVAMAEFPSRPRAAHDAHWAQIRADPSVVARTIVVDGRIAGNIVCWGPEAERTVGYWLGRQFWGRGIATAALSRFVEELPDRPLQAHVARGNHGSRRVLEKCGFQVVGEAPNELVLRLDR
jgi:RimJ/RimL family protein N-acetyltransferase